MPQDWIMGALGGLAVGLAAALYLIGNGRIMGISGILGSLVEGSAGNLRAERAVFVAALVAAPAAAAALAGGSATHLTGNLAVVALGGFLVGLGTRMANGCTSGHGVCGISRLSPRGIAATLVYILAGAVVVVLVRAAGGPF